VERFSVVAKAFARGETSGESCSIQNGNVFGN
jgi:hypothetical protein